jgi:hypothetical protein
MRQPSWPAPGPLLSMRPGSHWVVGKKEPASWPYVVRRRGYFYDATTKKRHYLRVVASL